MQHFLKRNKRVDVTNLLTNCAVNKYHRIPFFPVRLQGFYG